MSYNHEKEKKEREEIMRILTKEGRSQKIFKGEVQNA
jgi:hypothetical protein